jgi:hypothetical protein
MRAGEIGWRIGRNGWRRRGATAALLTLLAAALAAQAGAGAPAARATASRTLEATFSSGISNGWVRVERWRDNGTGFAAEDYPPSGRGDQDGQRKTFFGGVARPHSSRFLLYYAPGWDTGAKPTPVLLVHGANDTPDRAWANPNELGGFGCGALTCPSTGLMQYLGTRGYRVFAIGFPHKQGDNRYQAEQVHDAIEVIRSRTGAASVDVVGWSKGAFAARMYAASVKFSWGTAYAGKIRRLLLLGNPNTGYDYPFRHGWSHDFSIFPECGGTVNAPAPHTRMVCFGLWRNHPELSMYATASGDFFPGQRQMLARFDGTYPLPGAEQDWFTTYYGGLGFYTDGLGIQAAMDQGSLVGSILASPTPTSVPVYLLCGSAADIPTIHNEHTGPSDGVVFTTSCRSTSAIGTVGGNTLLAGVNHLELGWASSAMNQVELWLR